MSLQKRCSLAPPSPPPATTDLKPRVIACLNKLSDRDTLSLASSELESIAKTLNSDSFSPFLTCIHNTDSSSKSPVRKQCVSLLTLLSLSHGNSLSPHLSKMVSTVALRLRDPDSSVRSACVEAAAAMSSRITLPPFSTLSKPLVELLTVDQDSNAQIGAAMCLAAAIEASPEPEVEQLRKLLPRLGKLVKSEGFRAKAALLSVIGSIIGVGGASGKGVLDWLVPFLVEFLSSDVWAARKAAAEALGKVASAEKELAKQHKAACLGSLESRRFDKVKVVRETMNRTLELWKEVPRIPEEVSVSSQSRSSSAVSGNAIGGFSPPTSESSHGVGIGTSLPKKTVQANRSPPPSDASLMITAKKQSPLRGTDNYSKRETLNKTDHKKPSPWKIEIAEPQEMGCGYDIKRHDSGVSKPGTVGSNENPKTETKRVLFGSVRDNKPHKVGGLRSGSRVVPYNDDEICYNRDVEVSNPIEKCNVNHKDVEENFYNRDVEVSNPAEEFYENQKDVEDFSLIREQLLQIENQQSNLLDLIQRFIGSSQNGINYLESRVHGLEMALDEISYDLAVSSGRIPNTDPADNTCCKLPGADFLSSKFWRRTEGRYSSSASRFISSGNARSLYPVHNISDRDVSAEAYTPDSMGLQNEGRGGFVVNQVADIRSATMRNSGFYSRRMSN